MVLITTVVLCSRSQDSFAHISCLVFDGSYHGAGMSIPMRETAESRSHPSIWIASKYPHKTEKFVILHVYGSIMVLNFTFFFSFILTKKLLEEVALVVQT